MKINLTAEEMKALDRLVGFATVQRAYLDRTLFEIEALIGEDVDNLDELVGNGVDAEGLLEVLND